MTMMNDSDLDDLLALAARTGPVPGQDLMDRVLADALAVQAEAMVPRPSPQAVAAPGLLARLAAVFGGGPVLAGVCSTLLLGFAVGYLSPGTVDYLTGGSTEALDLFPSTEFLTTEG
jgi:hypothetical protein